MITVHRDKPNKDFLQIKNTHWMEFNKKYEPYALQLYLYLAKNADGYSFALSQKAAEEEAGIKKTSFHKYIDLLIQEGYLVRRSGNTLSTAARNRVRSAPAASRTASRRASPTRSTTR